MQEDVAHCLEQMLSDTWVIVGDRGKVGGEEGPWLQGGQEHVGQEKEQELALSMCQPEKASPPSSS